MVKDKMIRFLVDADEEAALQALANKEGLRSPNLYCAALVRRRLAEEAGKTDE